MKALVLLTIGIGAVLSGIASGQETLRAIYYSREGTIYMAEPDGTGETLVLAEEEPGEHVSGLAVRSNENLIYWSTFNDGGVWKLKRASLVGGSIEVLSSGPGSLRAFGLDRSNGDLYYVDTNTASAFATLIRRDSTSGENVVIIDELDFSTGILVSDIKIDHESNHAYIAFTEFISRVRTDLTEQPGTAMEALVSTGSAGLPSGMALDRSTNLLYHAKESPTGSTSVLERWNTLSRESVTADFPISGRLVSGPMATVAGSGIIHFTALHPSDFAFSIMRAAFDGDSAEVVLPGVSEFALDVVTAGTEDTEPPQITLFSPTSGTTNNQLVSIAGTVSDNNLVASVSWSLNSVPQGAITMLGDGTFGVSNIALAAGDNVIEVTAKDLDGNEAVEQATVTWTPDRNLSLGDPQTLSEGHLVIVPINLSSSGDVSGMTFEIGYQARDLIALDFVAGVSLEGSAVDANLITQLGTAKVSFANPGTTISSGDQLIGNLIFRARSVAADLTTTLTASIESVSNSTGNPIAIGNIASGTELTILQRKFNGDINANGKLDLGDASLMQRMDVDLDETRAWDEILNDLNGNSMLDVGDVVNVLRTIVGILPQPGEAQAIAALTSGGGPIIGPQGTLSIDKVTPSEGETVTVRIMLDELPSDITGVTFTVDYPVEALRLEDAGSLTTGSLVNGGALKLWNVAPSVSDYANQTGSVTLGASSSSAWPGSAAGGEVAVLQFNVTSNVSDRTSWPITLHSMSVPANDGYSIQDLGGDSRSVVGQTQSFSAWAATQFTAPQLSDPNISAWTADPDSDGESNGQEYFQGSSALAGNGQTLSGAVYLTNSGEEIPLIRLQRSITHQVIDYQLQQSTNLNQWNNVDSQVYQRTPTGNDTEDIYIGSTTVPAPSDRIFLRLVFTNSEAQL